MPLKIIKLSIEYCAENVWFFIFILGIFFLFDYLTDVAGLQFIGSIITSIFLVGYGLQVTEDLINGGKRLPKVMPKKLLIFGIKGYIIFNFYFLIQAVFLGIISICLNFPDFEIEELVLNFSHTLHLIRAHDPVSFTIFIISGLLIVYITTFFMELSMARLADGGKLRNSFNFRRIKHAIDIIGWREYAWEYTKIISSILILSFLLQFEISNPIIDTIFGGILSFLIFVIEFIGIAIIYKVYLDKKSD